MLSTALIVFREVLEAALVVSIVLAATKGVVNRGWWVGGGLLGGVIGAALIAVFADAISSWASGMGQEVFNACVMFIAVVMLAWHSIWMGKHSREMAQQLSAVGKAVAAGSTPLTGLAVVVGVAVLREGSEAVLFLYGIAAGDPGQTPQMIMGGLLGILSGVGLGAAMYAGLLQIPLKRLFAVTNALIILLAAGMASQGWAISCRPDCCRHGATRSGTRRGCSRSRASSARRFIRSSVTRRGRPAYRLRLISRPSLSSCFSRAQSAGLSTSRNSRAKPHNPAPARATAPLAPARRQVATRLGVRVAGCITSAFASTSPLGSADRGSVQPGSATTRARGISTGGRALISNVI